MSADTLVEFTITESAIAQVRTIMTQQTLEADERNLRIFVDGGGGCCGGGVGFGLAFDRAQPDDVKLERAGLLVVIDPQSLPYVHGATIDFVDTPEVTGFKVSAPQMKSQGGCGSGGGGGGCGSGGCSTGAETEHGHSHGGGGGCGSGGCGSSDTKQKKGHGGGCC